MTRKYFKKIILAFTVGLLLSSCSNAKNSDSSKSNESIDVTESSEYSDVTESVHNHIYSELIDEVKATCTENGVKAHYICLECNKIFDSNKNEISEEDLIIPATGHKYSNHFHIEETYHALICDNCGMIDEENKTPHIFDEMNKDDEYKASDKTCLKGSTYYYSCECGAKGEETFEVNDALGHNPSNTWTYDETHHWHECLNGCDEKLDYEEHNFDQQIMDSIFLKESANCIHGNIYYYSCKCGALGENTFDDNLKVEHSGSHYDYLPFSATHNGTSQYWECDICKEIYMLEDGLFSIEKVRYYDLKTLQIELPTYINIGKNFLANDTGFLIMQNGSTQSAGWFGYVTSDNNESTISINFNNSSNPGDVYYLLANSLITDINGKEYRLDKDYQFVVENNMWVMKTTPTIPAGTWEEKGSAPSVSEDDVRSVMYTIDLNKAALGYTDKSHIQEAIDIEIDAEDGIMLDTSSLIVKRNDESISISAQYFQSHILSFNLGFDDAAKGDLLIIEKGSILKLIAGENVINRKINSDVVYQYNGTGQWRRAKIVNFGLPSAAHVQWGMVLLQGENYFNVNSDTNCFYNGSVLADGYEYSGLPQGATVGLYFNGLSITNGFTFHISKGTSFDCNNMLIILLKEYNVSWNGSEWSFIE